MEEIDAIIIESLKKLHCDLDEDIISLKQFDPDMAVDAISRCLEIIIPDSTFPKNLPPSMSVKLKLTSSLASQIKNLGFGEDIGYQTILYCNEAEIRRVLMFLIEKLPREANKITTVEPTGYVPNLVKQIEQKVRDSLEQFWVPSSVLNRGCRKSETGLCFLSLGNSEPLRTKTIQVPCCSSSNDDLKEYWNRHLPVVTKQCGSKELIPSLLFNDFVIHKNDEQLRKCFKVSSSKEFDLPSDVIINEEVIVKNKLETTDNLDIEDKQEFLLEQLKLKRAELLESEQLFKKSEMQLEQMTKTRISEREALENLLPQINLKSKTLTVISKEENLQKLKNMIESSKNKLINLSQQWNNIQTPLLEEYRTLQNSLLCNDVKQQQEKETLEKMLQIFKTLGNDLREKTELEEKLKHKLTQINNSHTRSGYTRRIFEIIGNVKKQDEEIQKILKDTREVQREISQLTGQVDRSFTLADELIFRDAKQDETARRAYKLLAQLRDDCSGIIKAITDLGAVERECRNLQEQIDSETAKENDAKFARVNKDLQEIKRETEMLLRPQKK